MAGIQLYSSVISPISNRTLFPTVFQLDFQNPTVFQYKATGSNWSRNFQMGLCHGPVGNT
ncbi:hypothetical protein HOLleu_02101 [Holothuria leucospilota]|uniref:Uncharacterized protein n=1 Tax=Holothuria leucospilota TaxID=206669 RepID=A0A9Q1HJK4_HOLLE|nr:hypothetical protein HOLleu_02101 [Holothuria leucospilota]